MNDSTRRRMSEEVETTPPEATIDLLVRYRGGDARALELLLARNLAPLRRWATGRLPRGARDRGDTEDLVQETILKSLPHLEKIEYRGEGAVQAYLRGALMKRIRNEYRRVASRPPAETVDTAIEHTVQVRSRSRSGVTPLRTMNAPRSWTNPIANCDSAARARSRVAEIAAPPAARVPTRLAWRRRAVLRLAQACGREEFGPRKPTGPNS